MNDLDMMTALINANADAMAAALARMNAAIAANEPADLARRMADRLTKEAAVLRQLGAQAYAALQAKVAGTHAN